MEIKAVGVVKLTQCYKQPGINVNANANDGEWVPRACKIIFI